MRTNCGFTCLMIFLQVGGVTGSNDNKIRVLCCLSDVRIKLHICSQPIYFLKKESKKKKKIHIKPQSYQYNHLPPDLKQNQ